MVVLPAGRAADRMAAASCVIAASDAPLFHSALRDAPAHQQPTPLDARIHACGPNHRVSRAHACLSGASPDAHAAVEPWNDVPSAHCEFLLLGACPQSGIQACSLPQPPSRSVSSGASSHHQPCPSHPAPNAALIASASAPHPHPLAPRLSVHSAELLIVLFMCMAEALFGHLSQLPIPDDEEPLFTKVRAGWGGGRGRAGVYVCGYGRRGRGRGEQGRAGWGGGATLYRSVCLPIGMYV